MPLLLDTPDCPLSPPAAQGGGVPPKPDPSDTELPAAECGWAGAGAWLPVAVPQELAACGTGCVSPTAMHERLTSCGETCPAVLLCCVWVVGEALLLAAPELVCLVAAGGLLEAPGAEPVGTGVGQGECMEGWGGMGSSGLGSSSVAVRGGAPCCKG